MVEGFYVSYDICLWTWGESGGGGGGETSIEPTYYTEDKGIRRCDDRWIDSFNMT